ncbi:DUF4232 domain-containing protein [Streptomyces sp. NBC_00234]|uniref:DUF4232 domain-containing protein n=1 Tax=Streptomyces sp. NBC_00234 TaxID=2903638 RepID=UPI002E2A244F|nr:DUF4232 domain-containing protein [Streptomyces sp. NBC_00234]
MRNLHLRRAARTSALGAVALIASLSLTACQGDDEAASGGSASAPAGSSSPPPAESSGASADKSSAAPSTDQGKNSSAPDSGSGSGSGSGDDASTAEPQDVDDAVVLACTGTNTKLTMTEVQRPVNHMLLTMTNTGSKACNAYSYPYLRFGDAQSVPKTFDDSKPQAVATINPGESVYTGVMTSAADGSGTNGYSTKDLTVSFQNRDGNSDGTGSAVKVPLAKSVFVDSSLSVTYWQTSMDDALTY